MVRPLDLSPRDDAATIVRRFAAATNRLVAGRRFAVAGEGPRAIALAGLLTALGGREDRSGPDYLFRTGGDLSLAELIGPYRGARAWPLVVDAGRPRLSLQGVGPWTTARPGVAVARVGSAELFLVNTDDRAADPALDAGRRVAWAHRFMPVSRALAGELAMAGSVEGIRIGISMVLEPKTANLAIMLADAGARVSVYAHPAETDDAVADELRGRGIPVDARSDAGEEEAHALALAFLDRAPQILIDDGSHLIRLAHRERPALLGSLLGAAEETTSGLRPLRRMERDGELRTPVVAVNDARTKTRFDNRYGTGQSCVFAILDLLESSANGGAPVRWRGGEGASLDGRTVAVAGFGPVGEGVAQYASALGARVVVAERDQVRALEAVFAGHRTAPLEEAVRGADLVISASGVAGTIDLAVLEACADGAVVAVAGGVPQEVAIDAALRRGAAYERVARKVDALRFGDGRRVLVLDDGGCINVTAGEGNPIEIMDLSFAVQLGAVGLLAERRAGDRPLGPGVHPAPDGLDERIARAALSAFSGSAADEGQHTAGESPEAER